MAHGLRLLEPARPTLTSTRPPRSFPGGLGCDHRSRGSGNSRGASPARPVRGRGKVGVLEPAFLTTIPWTAAPAGALAGVSEMQVVVRVSTATHADGCLWASTEQAFPRHMSLNALNVCTFNMDTFYLLRTECHPCLSNGEAEAESTSAICPRAMEGLGP